MHENTLEALQKLETIRETLGLRTFHVLVENVDLYEDLHECINTIRSCRLSDRDAIVHSGLATPRNPTFKPDLQFDPRRRVVDSDPLPKRLKLYQHARERKVAETLKAHLEAANYGRENIEFDDAQHPRLLVKRYHQRWHTSQWTVDIEAVVPRRWVQTGATDVAKAFEYKFFPLACEPVKGDGEARIYQVHRAKFSAKKDDVTIKEDQGYAAFITRKGQTPLTGWGATREAAIADIKKSRAKEARARLLKV
jgi:hypothetical protein